MLYADENFPAEVVEALRRLGHDVVTAQEAGQANRAIPDQDVLAHAVECGRTLVTLNRWDFVGLHVRNAEHHGIVVCSADPEPAGQATRIDAAIRSIPSLKGQLVRVNRPG